MKKITFTIACLLGFGIIMYQDRGRILLILISQGNMSGTTQASNVTTANNIYPPYNDGVYTGNVVNAYYGNVQIQSTIKNGKITEVKFLQKPNAATRSVVINTIADPNLSQEAIQSQSTKVAIVSGATASSEAFIQSLTNALTQAKKA